MSASSINSADNVAQSQPRLRELLQAQRIAAVLVLQTPEEAAPVAEALLAAHLPLIELTLRTPRAVEIIAKLHTAYPELIIGAGTVLSIADLEAVQQAGAHFAVAPGLNPAILSHAATIGIPFMPGIATPSDIESALTLGYHTLKFFHAEALGGLSYLKAIAAPYIHRQLAFMPLGGLTQQRVADYLQSDLVAAVGGSWIASRPLIEAHNWTEIGQRAAAAVAQARSYRL